MHVSYGLDDGLLFAVYLTSDMYTVPRFPADFTGAAEDLSLIHISEPTRPY